MNNPVGYFQEIYGRFSARTCSEAIVYFLIGVAHVFWGVRFADSQFLGLSTLPVLLTVQFAAYLSGVLVTPILAKFADLRAFVPISIGMYCLAICVGATSWSMVLLLGSSLLLGLMAGMQETIIAAAVLADRGRRQQIFILEKFFGLGAFTFPFFVALTDVSDLFYLYGICICILAIVALGLWISSDIGEAGHSAVSEVPRLKTRYQSDRSQTKKSMLFTLMVVALFYGGFETNFVNWLPAFGSHSGGNAIGEIAISLFWVGIVVGRLVINLALSRFSTGFLLFVSGVALTVFVFVLGLSLNITHRFWLYVLILIIGLSSSVIFPGLLSYAAGKVHVDTARVTSALVSSATLGGSVCAMPFGFIVSNFGERSLCLVFAVLGVLAILLMYSTTIVRRH
ncbi:MFS transporter [Corynebacterium canis]|uniref:MFS transporter n=1 Tax=Corynebacterium canis TaxID=679663 RepID=A0A5C5UD45_9CORY|nr:MFS transporter [Corynebacterium canis]TWT24014.1 MFS transporter [Corynebacterium canis]